MTLDARHLDRIVHRTISFTVQQQTRAGGKTHAERTRMMLDALTPGVAAARIDSEGGGKGGHSDPTADAACHPDPVNVWARQFEQEWKRIEQAMTAIEKLGAAIRERGERLDRAGNARTIPTCKNPHCGDDVVLPPGEVPIRGRCEPCADYAASHNNDDAGPKVIADRRRWREQQAMRRLGRGMVDA